MFTKLLKFIWKKSKPAKNVATHHDKEQGWKNSPYSPCIKVCTTEFIFCKSLRIIEHIKNPEITKKISTPINPAGNKLGNAWKVTTNRIAIALKPSMSGR